MKTNTAALFWVLAAAVAAIALARSGKGQYSGGGGGGHPEFSAGQAICFTGAGGDPGNGSPVWIVAVLDEGYRWGLNSGGQIIEQGFIPYGFIDAYRAEGGTVQLCTG